MRVGTMLDKLHGLDRNLSIEFHDVTTGRRAPINSFEVSWVSGLNGEVKGIVLTNNPDGLKR